MPHEAVKTISTGLQLFSTESVPENIYHHSHLSDSDRCRLVVNLFLIQFFHLGPGAVAFVFGRWGQTAACARKRARCRGRAGRRVVGRVRLAFLGCKSATFKIFATAAQKRIPTTKHVYEDRARAVVISDYEAQGAKGPKQYHP